MANNKTSGGNSAFHNFNNDFAHIEDPNERRRLALAEIDKAPFGWYHVRAILVAGTGFFTDSYDIFCVSLLTIMLGIVYHKGALTTPQDTAIKLSTSAGTVIGQVGFGALADVVGRKKMYGLELILIIVATLAQALTGPGPGTSVVGLIIFWRVLMGIGTYSTPRSAQFYVPRPFFQPHANRVVQVLAAITPSAVLLPVNLQRPSGAEP